MEALTMGTPVGVCQEVSWTQRNGLGSEGRETAEPLTEKYLETCSSERLWCQAVSRGHQRPCEDGFVEYEDMVTGRLCS